MGIFDSLVKECMEEASIGEELVRKYVRLNFSRLLQNLNWLAPARLRYVYDLAIPAGVDPSPFEPKPLDGEVQSFELLTQDEVTAKLRAGLFKPNCALVLLDFFIRLGYITPDNEPEFMKIVPRLHGRFDYDRW